MVVIKKGFTLIEMLVVITITAILGAISSGPIMRYIDSSKAESIIHSIQMIRRAITSDAASHLNPKYADSASIEILKNHKRISGPVYQGPISKHITGPWGVEMLAAGDITRNTSSYYIYIRGIPNEAACNRVKDYLTKTASVWSWGASNSAAITKEDFYVYKVGRKVIMKPNRTFTLVNPNRATSPLYSANQKDGLGFQCSKVRPENRIVISFIAIYD